MDKNKEFLCYIYQVAQMGKDNLAKVIDMVEDKDLRVMLEQQRSQYQDVYNRAFEQSDGALKNSSPMNRFYATMGINMETMRDRSPSHIAEIVILGNTRGIIDMTRRLKQYKNADEQITSLADDLISIEQTNVENLKQFL